MMGFHILDKGEEASTLTKVVMNVLNGFSGILLKMCDGIEKIPTKLPEILAMIAYTVFHFVMMIYHEPWFDEAEAWQIARYASIKEILFEIPHYEGHTPLWDLILLPFAKGGAPYELSLSMISFIFAGLAVALIIFKAPWKRIIRLLLPFTYFFFYQYGVICRPYCVMMLAFVLMGIFYKEKNEKPGRYVLSLVLLTLTFPMGLIIAGGIAVVWLVQIMDEVDIKLWIKDRRLLWLAGLLVIAIISIIQIMPRENTYATTPIIEEKGNSLAVRLLYTFLALPSDLVITNAWWNQGRLSGAALSLNNMLPACIFGLLIWFGLFVYGKKKKMLPLLMVPYILYTLFCSILYMSNHHMGIGLLFFMFWMWAASEEKTVDKDVLGKVSTRDKKALESCAVVMGLWCICISLWWTIVSCITDINGDYAVGREEAIFIREHGLDRYNFFAEFEEYTNDEGEVIAKDMNYTYHTPNVLAYFGDNIFYNASKPYIEHKRLNLEEEAKYLEPIRKIKPEILMGIPDLQTVYGMNDSYSLVYGAPKKKAWKATYDLTYSNIYVRDDLLNELGLKELKHVKAEWAPVG